MCVRRKVNSDKSRTKETKIGLTLFPVYRIFQTKKTVDKLQ